MIEIGQNLTSVLETIFAVSLIGLLAGLALFCFVAWVMFHD